MPPAKVAEWAGQSVEILFRIYATFLDGGDEEFFRRIEAAYGHHQPRQTGTGRGHTFGTTIRPEPPQPGQHRTQKQDR